MNTTMLQLSSLATTLWELPNLIKTLKFIFVCSHRHQCFLLVAPDYATEIQLCQVYLQYLVNSYKGLTVVVNTVRWWVMCLNNDSQPHWTYIHTYEMVCPLSPHLTHILNAETGECIGFVWFLCLMAYQTSCVI